MDKGPLNLRTMSEKVVSVEDVIFKVGGKDYPIPRNRIPPGSYLELALTTGVGGKTESPEINDLTSDEFDPVYQWLVNRTLPKDFDIEQFYATLDRLLISPLESYELSLILEEDMRAHMYQPGYEDHPMNTELFYGLVDVTPELWKNLEVDRPQIPNLLFPQGRLQPVSWNQIADSLDELNFLFDVPNIFIAGGRVFSAMFEGDAKSDQSVKSPRYSDVDIFLITETEKDALSKIRQLKDVIKRHFTEFLRETPVRRPPRPSRAPRQPPRDDEEDEENPPRYDPYPEELAEEAELIVQNETTDQELEREIEISNRMETPKERQPYLDALEEIMMDSRYLYYEDYDTQSLEELERSLGYAVKDLLRDNYQTEHPGVNPEIGYNQLMGPREEITTTQPDQADPNHFLTGPTYDLLLGDLEEDGQIKIYETRSANTVTITVGKLDFQVVLRIYRSPSEVLHGFDVDSCAVGYDGNHIWATHRALFALINGYNTVNFNRLSPSYPFRLVKYAMRGMSIFVPDFDRDRIEEDALERRFNQYLTKRKRRAGYRYIRKLTGLDYLLYSEYHWRRLRGNDKVAQTLIKLAEENSDYNKYDPVPFTRYFFASFVGQTVTTLLEYLIGSAPLYPEASAQYMPHVMAILEKLMPLPWPPYVDLVPVVVLNYTQHLHNSVLSLKVNNFFLKKSPIFFVTSDQLDQILEIDPDLYAIFQILTHDRVDIPQQTRFKTIQPGEQMTNTFNQLVLADNRVWYQGEFYDLS